MAWSSQSLYPGDLCPTPELLGLTLLFCSPDVPPPPPHQALEQAGQGQDPWELRLCRGPCSRRIPAGRAGAVGSASSLPPLGPAGPRAPPGLQGKGPRARMRVMEGHRGGTI